MRAVLLSRGVMSAALLGLILGMGQARSHAQEESTPEAPKAEKKLSGRLPPYFAEVVSKDQRTKIYEIQQRYAEQMRKLRDELSMLDQKQLDEIQAVLSPEQRDHVAKRTADAKAKRTSTKKEPVATESSG